MAFRKFFLAAVFVFSASHGLATGEIESLITAADRARLEDYSQTRKEALDEAKAGSTSKDLVTLDTILAKTPIAFGDFDMTGNWQCRTIKIGGLSPVVVYGWFKCKVTDDGSGWMLEKISGSQRTKGRFFTENDKQLTYLGSFHVGKGTPKPYGSGPESDQVGYAFRTGRNEWRIEFPPHIMNPSWIFSSFAARPKAGETVIRVSQASVMRWHHQGLTGYPHTMVALAPRG
jgi:hypothetical protein